MASVQSRTSGRKRNGGASMSCGLASCTTIDPAITALAWGEALRRSSGLMPPNGGRMTGRMRRRSIGDAGPYGG